MMQLPAHTFAQFLQTLIILQCALIIIGHEGQKVSYISLEEGFHKHYFCPEHFSIGLPPSSDDSTNKFLAKF